MAFNILDIFRTDFWDFRKERKARGMVRPPARIVSIDPEYRPYDRGRGQDIRSETHWQIPFVQQKALYQRNAWVKKCIDHIASNAAGLEWQITVEDEYLSELESDPRLKLAKELVTRLFLRPNTLGISFQDMIKMIVRDLKIMDAAVIEKVRDPKGRLVQLKPFGAETIRIDVDEHGKIHQYIQQLRGTNLFGMYANSYKAFPRLDDRRDDGYITFEPDNVIYMRLNPRSESPYGSSPISSLVEALYADISTDISLYNYLFTGGVNVGFLSIGQELDNDKVEYIRYKFHQSSSPGNHFEFPILASSENVEWHPMQVPNQQMQIAELQMELRNKILAVLSVPPNELGLTGNTRGQVYSQQDVFWGNAVIPMMRTIADRFTREILWEFDERLKFEFLPPKEYQYESVISRIVALEKEGLISDKTKMAWLKLPPLEEPHYVQKKKQLELQQMELSVKAQAIELAVQENNWDVLLKQPQLQYETQMLEAEGLKQQLSGSNQNDDLALKQLELQKQQISLQDRQMKNELVLTDKEFELKKLEIDGALKQLQKEYNIAVVGGQQQPETPTSQMSNEQIVQGLVTGQLNTSALSQMMQNGQINPEQLKDIRSASQLSKTLSMAKSIHAITGLHNNIDEIKPIKPNNPGLRIKENEAELSGPRFDFAQISKVFNSSLLQQIKPGEGYVKKDTPGRLNELVQPDIDQVEYEARENVENPRPERI
jgi:HK97 family phage portal protein